jgi:hypothetical protein
LAGPARAAFDASARGSARLDRDLDCGAPERLGPELSARLDPERTV